MGIIKVLGRDVRWGKDLNAAPTDTQIDKTVIPEELDPKVLDAVTKEIADIVLPVSAAGRQTLPDNKSLVQIIGNLMLVKPGFNEEWLEALNNLAMFHPDISAAVDNISLANTEFKTTFDEDTPDSLQREMLQVLRESRDNWYKYADGINGWIDDSFTQCAITGAMSHEWLISKNIDSIAGVCMVDPKNILFNYEPDKALFTPVQKVPNTFLYTGQTVMGKYKPLNSVTYRYLAMRRLGESPYALPPFLSSLENIIIQKNMVKNIGNIVDKLGVLGFLKVMMNAPQRSQGETDAQYYDRLRTEQEKQIDSAKKGYANKVMLGWKNVQEIEMQSTNDNVQGAEALMEMNDRLVVNGMKQNLEMMNRKNTTSETFGRVILAKMGRQLEKYQKLAATAISYGDLIHLQLMGYPVQKVMNKFEPVMLGDKAKEEEAYGKKIDNANKLYNAGIINQDQKAQYLGFDEPDQEEPRVVETPPDTKTGNDGGTDMPKSTSANNYKVALPTQFIELLSNAPEYGMGYHVADIETKRGTIKDVVITNSQFGWFKTQLKTDEITSVMLKKKAELVSFFEQRLGIDKPVYWGYEEHAHEECSHTEELGVPKKELKFWNNYNKEVADAWKETAIAIEESIIENLSQVTEGVSAQAMEGNVLYSVYSKVESVFKPLIKPIIQKHVREIYDYYRKSQAPWAHVAAGKRSIPDAVFNLTDIRAMEYFKNSDTLYMGKFVTDPDTRKRMTKFIKENYIDKNTEIGNNAEGVKAFASEFKSELLDEDWKLRRVIDTSVNRMRNTAAVSYMNQAEVKEFAVVGISDRLQCTYCESMNGKVLSIETEMVKIDRMVNSPPEMVPDISPFITSLDITADQVKEMSGVALQETGIGAPSYHPLCRCVVVAEIR